MSWPITQAWIQSQALPRLAHILLIVTVAWFGYRLLKITILRMEKIVEDDDSSTVSDQEQRAQTLGQTLQNAGQILIYIIAGTMVLRELGLDIGPILAGVGVVGLAVGFGAQTLIKDMITGFFILLENQFRVGDTVQVGDITGNVEKMTLRATFLRDLNGTLHVIPNGEIRTLANQTKDWSRAVVNVGVSYDTDLDQALQVLQDVGRDLREDAAFARLVLEDPVAIGPLEFGDSAITVRLMVKTGPGQQWRVARELRRRIKEAFDREDIEIPYPQYEIRTRTS